MLNIGHYEEPARLGDGYRCSAAELRTGWVRIKTHAFATGRLADHVSITVTCLNPMGHPAATLCCYLLALCLLRGNVFYVLWAGIESGALGMPGKLPSPELHP